MKPRQFPSHGSDAPGTCCTHIHHGRSLDPLHHEVAPVVADLEHLGGGVAMCTDELHRPCFGDQRATIPGSPQNSALAVFEDIGISSSSRSTSQGYPWRESTSVRVSPVTVTTGADRGGNGASGPSPHLRERHPLPSARRPPRCRPARSVTDYESPTERQCIHRRSPTPERGQPSRNTGGHRNAETTEPSTPSTRRTRSWTIPNPVSASGADQRSRRNVAGTQPVGTSLSSASPAVESYG